MKKFVYLSAALTLAMSLFACQDGGRKAIGFDSLPETAKTFINTHFSDKQVSAVYSDNSFADKEYEVVFSDGANVDFTKKGEWDEVEDRDADGVPLAIIPQPIADYVTANHAGQYVVQITKDRNEYVIELNSTLEISFDADGNFVSYDD